MRGAATDPDGFYGIVGLTPAALRRPRLGSGLRRPRLDTLALAPGVRSYDVALAPAALGEAVVEAEAAAARPTSTPASSASAAEDVRSVPAPDVSGDLVNYVVSLSGVVTSGDRGGQLFIRGGEPTQNQVFLDGIPVFQPFHVLGFYSAFPADLLQTADLYAGGYDASYGGQISSVLDVTSRTGNLRRVAATASVAPFVASASVEGPIVRDHVSFLASARVSTVDHIAARYVSAPLPFHFGDLFGAALLRRHGQEPPLADGACGRGTAAASATPMRRRRRSRAPRRSATRTPASACATCCCPPTCPCWPRSSCPTQTSTPSSGRARRRRRRGAPAAPPLGPPPRRRRLRPDVPPPPRRRSARAASSTRTGSGRELGGQFQNVQTERVTFAEAGLYLQPEFVVGRPARVAGRARDVAAQAGPGVRRAAPAGGLRARPAPPQPRRGRLQPARRGRERPPRRDERLHGLHARAGRR